ncbi:MAG: 50S ribosomal protein L9 [Candidatus Doudnabacteria bacterium RIFCSPHIGHO2_01_FULL_49_9]|uniref:Large ribosomal subunit protein bL9 n=1 Tax=Candidatus Doudnabacteria bacterium RIFCSPHIGHO2_01_FULL_49_9 TaxID=1817827 RepID=A0A1F5P2B9_9BACT|nr:MAG: 50S ribosomal protein L9 [Candidatus Doudnabacteria bacterium RIFCSPHIGHO2_01_FULL_49_9]
MKVILTKDVKKLGRVGDVVEVAHGFARNFLLLKNLAKIADRAGLEENTTRLKARELHAHAEKQNIEKLFKSLESQPTEFILPGDADGHLYSGLKESEILARISRGGETPQKGLSLSNYASLKQSGEYTLTLQTPQNKNIKFKILIKCQS